MRRRHPATAEIDLALWRHRQLDRECDETMARDECHFCHDRPVVNAASWFTLGAPHHVPCPVCGKSVEPAPDEELSGPAQPGSPSGPMEKTEDGED
jgi:hypothetical protein